MGSKTRSQEASWAVNKGLLLVANNQDVPVFAFPDIHGGLVRWVLGQTPRSRVFSQTSICATERCAVPFFCVTVVS